MLNAIRDNEPELKRPKMWWFNLIMTLALLAMLIMDIAHGGILFMLGAAIALTANYRSSKLVTERLDALAADSLAPALATWLPLAPVGLALPNGRRDSLRRLGTAHAQGEIGGGQAQLVLERRVRPFIQQQLQGLGRSVMRRHHQRRGAVGRCCVDIGVVFAQQ